MINEIYTVDILVNDKPIRKYPHNGKLFVEARKGDSYSIRIKNNSYSRVLAVTSADGLDTLTGKSATENGNGYVINGYNSLTIDGFRVSDEKVARFVFDQKNSSYAASKEDGSERNVGVIGIRLFTELVKPSTPPPIVIREEHHHHHDHYPKYPTYPTYPQYPNSPWNSPTILGNEICYGTNTNAAPGAARGCGVYLNCTMGAASTSDPTMDFCDSKPLGVYSKTLSSPVRSMNMNGANNSLLAQVNTLKTNNASDPIGFDMGTKYGSPKESRVIEVEFEKGILALTTNIYYASRQSLVEMGVPISNEKQVSFPEPFVGNKYSVPPKDWKG